MKTNADEKVNTFLNQKAPGAYTVEHIAKRTGLAKSTVQKSLTRLRNAGLVERSLEPGGNLWFA